jgi:hypothetical protein
MRRSVALLVLLLGGCDYYFEDDDGDDPGGADDGGLAGDRDGGGVFPDAQVEACDAAALLPNGFVPVESVSTGAVTNEEDEPGVFLTEIDASAGGAAGQTTNPFIYLDLLADDGAARVELDDVAALESDAWDLALKRYVVRTNGGDSGPGPGVVATVAGAELTFIEEEPDSLPDDWTAADCSLLIDDVGGPLTRFSNWYRVMNGRFQPRAIVHVVRLRDGSHAEIDIDTYYADGSNPNRGGVYRLRWRRF